MAKKDINLVWSKRDKDFVVAWTEGSRRDAHMVMNELIGTHQDSNLLKELKDRGYDLSSIKFSISKKV